MRSGELERQFRRLSLYVDRLGNINMQATLIAGFAFSAASPDVLEMIMDNEGRMSTIYVVLVFIAISLSCWVVTVSLNTQIKAEKLAMEGPDGSVRYALAAIIKVSDLIAQLHSCSAACLGGAMLASIWTYLPATVAVTLSVLIVLVAVHAVRYNQELDELFSLEGKRLVGRGEHLQRALLVAQSEDEEREARGKALKPHGGARNGGVAEPLLDSRASKRSHAREGAPSVSGARAAAEPEARERGGIVFGGAGLRWPHVASPSRTGKAHGQQLEGDASRAQGRVTSALGLRPQLSTCSASTVSSQTR